MESGVNQVQLTRSVFEHTRKVVRHPVASWLRGVAIEKYKAIMTDISEAGCQLEVAENLLVGAFLTLTIPIFFPTGAKVGWHDCNKLGLQFVERLHVAIVDHISNTFAH